MLYLYSNFNVYIQLNHCGSTVKSMYLYITIIVLLQYYCVILQRAVTVGDNGVRPRLSLESTSMPPFSVSSLTICRRPSPEACDSGVRPSLSLEFTWAPP